MLYFLLKIFKITWYFETLYTKNIWQYIIKKKKKPEGSKMFFSFSIHDALEAFFTVQKRLSAA